MRLLRHLASVKHRRPARVIRSDFRTAEAPGYFFSESPCTNLYLTSKLLSSGQTKKLRIYIAQEAAGIAELHLPIAETAFCIREITMRFGPRYSHVEQTPFFLERPGIVGRNSGKKTFFHPYDKHIGKLKTFGRMNGHQCHFRYIIILFAVLVGEQRHLRQIIGKQNMAISLFFPVGTEIVDSANKLFNIFLTAQILGSTVLINVIDDTRTAHDVLPQSIGILLRSTADKSGYQVTESLKFGNRSFIQRQSVIQRPVQHFPKADMLLRGRINQLVQGRISYSSRRVIDHPLECLLIVRIDSQAEISDHILDLFPLIERKSPIHLIRDPFPAQCLFKDTALRIRAVQHRTVMIIISAAPMKLNNLVGHDFTLLHIAVGA